MLILVGKVSKLFTSVFYASPKSVPFEVSIEFSDDHLFRTDFRLKGQNWTEKCTTLKFNPNLKRSWVILLFDQMFLLVQLSKKFLPLLRTEFVSSFLLKSVLVCHLTMIVTFVVFIEVRCLNSHRKDEKVRYDVGIKGFQILHSNWSQTFRYLRLRNSAQNRISAVWPTLKSHNS
jgi:hypothetical protein